eukprot:CCRYP_003228-RA/>CCRYP_003228-RA protein AED:0.43 eAED:0.43 QI:0/-1/0/1/-1/1/1/0/137
MPKCYRTGGLACQHRFGARHGTSVVIFGLFKMGLAVIFGSSVLTLLGALPVAVSGVMVAIVGLERVGTVCWSSRWRRKKTGGGTRSGIFDQNSTAGEDFECNVTGNVIIATSRTDHGTLAGWVAHMIYGNGLLDFVA